MINYLSDEDLINKINNLQVYGFDSIHLPGGTSIDGSSYSGVVAFSYNEENKKIYFLGVPSSSKKEDNSKDKKEGETCKEVAIREFFEETGLSASVDSMELLLKLSFPDNRIIKKGKQHTKCFFLANEFSGAILTFDGPNPLDPSITAPLWIPANFFIKKLHKNHLEALNKAINILRNKTIEYYDSLSKI